MAKPKSRNVYIFKVALKDAKRISRRIAVRGDQTLDQFHNIIFQAFDRYDPHLYSFYFPKPGARGRARMRDAVEYTHPFVLEDAPFGDRDLHNAAAAKLEELNLETGQTFDYLFDFGDDWLHEIKVEKTDGEVEPGHYPRILEKRGESPPQYPSDPEDEDSDET